VLVEVSMAGWPRMFDEIIFSIQSRGYTPVLAHPERYAYEDKPAVFRKLKDRGVLMQLNLLAVLGYYGPSIRANALRYLDAELYDFCGSDLHHERHQRAMERLLQERELMERLEQYK